MRQQTPSSGIRSRTWWAVSCLVAVLSTGIACSQSDQQEAERKARETAARAKEEAGKAADKAAAATKDAASKLGENARDAALKGASAAADAGAKAAVVAGEATQVAAVKAAGLLRTSAIKSALLADQTLDTSDVNIDTDEARKIVVLKGRVRSAREKTAIGRIAAEKAPGYTVQDQLVVR